jgi:tetratricopeptide (TPR) repeat protein
MRLGRGAIGKEGAMKKLCGLAMVMAVAGMAQAAPSQPEAARPGAAQPAAAQPANLDRASRAAEALSHGNNMEALSRADEAVRINPKSGWAHYNRAAALAGLNRIDEAVQAYDQASATFTANDTRGRSLAIWGKAHALYRAGRCTEASQAFSDYAKLVGSSDPQAVAMASDRSTSCKPSKDQPATASATATATPATRAAAATTTTTETPMRTKTSSDEDRSGLPSLANPPK